MALTAHAPRSAVVTRPAGVQAAGKHLALLMLCVAVSACGGGGNGSGPGGNSAAAPDPLDAPSNLRASAADSAATLSWETVAGATLYTVYRATESGVEPGNYASLAGGVRTSVTGTGVTVDGLINDTTYYFVVAAADASRESAVSNEVQVTPQHTPQPPPPPENLDAAAGDGEVRLDWDDVAEATAYNLYLAAQSGVGPGTYTNLDDGARLSSVVNPTRVANLDNGRQYFFVVTAWNADGESGISNQAQATPGPLPSANARLMALTLSVGSLTPGFDPAVTGYSSEVDFGTASVTVTATSEDAAANLNVNGVATASGLPSASVPLGEGANVIEILVTAEDGVTTRTYSVSVTRQSVSSFAQQAFVKAANTGAGDQFGYSVALSGDTLAVGAPFEASGNGVPGDDSAADAGAVYVFVRNGGVWTQQAYLKASNSGTLDEFGNSVALSGDTLAVAAHNEDSAATGIGGNQLNNSATDSGAVYVFTRDGAGTWSQQAYVKASNAGAFDQFGVSVAVSGDTLAVGALSEDSDATGIDGNQNSSLAPASGAAYVFTRDASGTWSQQAYVKASNTDTTDLFGYRVGVSGDTLAVSALEEDSAATGIDGDAADDMAPQSGAVYVFVRGAGGQWSQQTYLKASNTDANDNFGAALALDGDTLAVGARYEDSDADTVNGGQMDDTAFNAGAAYVFVRDLAGVWSQQAYLKSANSGARDELGSSIALSGDALVVGAPGEASAATGLNGDAADDSAGDAGAAYLFTRAAGAWSPGVYIKASNTGAEDAFGSAVAVTGDTVVAGAPLEDSGGTGIDPASDNDAAGAGAGYVFLRN